MNPHSHSATTICGSVASLSSGLFAVAIQTPGSILVAIAGLFGSVAVPIVVEWMRGRRSRALLVRDMEIARLKHEVARHFDVITDLRAKLDDR
jgi:hypothetical protein